MRIVALIPARAGSKRVEKKNTRLLGGKPLLQWTIEAAFESGIFSHVGVSTEDDAIAQIAWDCGALTWRRRCEHAQDDSPDIEWVRDALQASQCQQADAFAILRPTTPFRSAATIRAAWQHFKASQPADSLRAVRFANEPPQKMWVLTLGGRMVPLLPFHHARSDARGPLVPWHSSPTQSLPAFVVQTAGLEIAWTRTVETQRSISGTSVLSYFMDERESLDINTESDWERAERYVAALQAPPAA